MRASGFAASAVLFSLAAASDAPVANTNIGITFAATLPNNGDVTGSILGAAAPNGQGSNIQISLYNLPQGASLSYGITANKIRGGDCSGAGGLLNPYDGVTGSDCTANNKAACQVGDLSGKHGNVVLATGGAGTGYYTANVVDDYLSTDRTSDAFFGNKAIIVMDQNGTPLTCANFVNQQKLSADAARQNETESASESGGAATMTSGSVSQQASATASSTPSGNVATRTAAVGLSVAVGAMAALLL